MQYAHELLCRRRDEMLEALNKAQLAVTEHGEEFFFPDGGPALDRWNEASEKLSILLKHPTGGAKVPPEVLLSAALSVTVDDIVSATAGSLIQTLEEHDEETKCMVDLLCLSAQVKELGDAVYCSLPDGESDKPHSETINLT